MASKLAFCMVPPIGCLDGPFGRQPGERIFSSKKAFL